jgi:UDP-N-acetylmuramoyl-L-alanyl-D-glutamate--2,6-diaminopimelate ligase
MEFVFRVLKKIIPEPIFKFFQPSYHWLLGFLSALFYGFPSKKLSVIGVTGTKGKTTTCNLIAQILNSAGFKTGMATTVNFRIGNKEWINDTKQTMPGRFHLQKLLVKMKKQGCQYAVVETSSEGILQYRHRFIDYKMAVFTNLSPEHIERHGSFESYRAAKLKLFEMVSKKYNGVGVYNLDDENAGFFLKPAIPRQYVYTLQLKNSRLRIPHLNVISQIRLSPKKTSFLFSSGDREEKFEMPLIGEFNVSNAAAAICVAISQGIPWKQIKKALAKAVPPPGRLEIIDKGQNFTVILDYAHEPASLEAVYKAVIDSKLKTKKSKLICLLGAQGGGRDKWKRPEMGKIAAKYCNEIILTNEDPYDENPAIILKDIEKGLPRTFKKYLKISDRREAIKKALFLAKRGDAVILTGKGGEVWMCVKNGKKILWDERKIVEKEIKTKN